MGTEASPKRYFFVVVVVLRIYSNFKNIPPYPQHTHIQNVVFLPSNKRSFVINMTEELFLKNVTVKNTIYS